MRYEYLFEPIRLGNLLFRNRIFASPQDTYRLTSENFLNDDATAFYEIKARGGFASVCVGDFMVDSRAGHSHPFQLRGDDVKGRVSLTRTSASITRHGARAAVELNHAGQIAGPMAQREGFVYGVSEGVRSDGTEIREMDEDRIEMLIKCYADAAAFARQCGFGMITLHGGHGWLLAQFMSPLTNKRRDRWGGDINNRMRFPLAVTEAVRLAVGPNTPIEMRISGAEIVKGGYDIDEGVEIARALDGRLDLIHISAGHHEDDSGSMVTHPTMFMPDGVNVKYAAEVKKHVKTPVATVGALTDPRMMEEIIASGKADVVELGRQTLADPDLPLKAMLGKEDEINKCLRCFMCFSSSTNAGIFYCSVNPEVGFEREALAPSALTRFPKKVLIAGGGVAGMQAAITAAKAGHDVILCEKSDRLGGTLICEENVPFKSKISEYIKRQSLIVTRSGVDVRLNAPVTPELAEKLKPDVLIAALGSKPVVPNIPGLRERAVPAEDVYRDPTKAGKTVCILGGGLVGLELGIYLAQLGRTVTVVEMLPVTLVTKEEVSSTSERISNPHALEPGANFIHGIAMAQELLKLPELKIMTSTRAVQVTETGLKAEGPSGAVEIAAETVVCAAGYAPLYDETKTLSGVAPEFHRIGDCILPGNIKEATKLAHRIALDIGRL
ncbi:MAG: FAD-dependent oxidoreductase [Oscillospiraceae bacterium]|nr:FAD-dependent oxidoreductase [Oscillospiraceae bacterium]